MAAERTRSRTPPRRRRWNEELRQVGRTELRVAGLSLGCSPLGELWDDVEPEEALSAVRTAHRLGLRHFDTAPWYGNGCSEARTGMALNALRRSGGSFTVSTKVGRALEPEPRGTAGPWDGPWHGGYDLRVRYDYGYEGVLQQHRDSCLRLGLPQVDALVIHDLDCMFASKAGAPPVERSISELRGESNPRGRGGVAALRELKERGSIKAFGMGCNVYKFGCKDICTRVEAIGGLDFFLLAGPYNLLNQEALEDLLPLCRERGMSVFVGAPFASGVLAVGAKPARAGQTVKYMYEIASDEVLRKVEKMEAVCAKHGVSLPAAAVQFPLFHPRVATVLCGVKAACEVERAVRGMEEAIPDALWKELKTSGLIRSDAPIAGEDTSHL